MQGHWGYAFATTPDHSELRRVQLEDLRPGAMTLTGDSFVVYSATGSPAEPDDWDVGQPLAFCDESGCFTARPTGDFQDPAAEVNAYYQLTRYLHFYQSLGFSGFKQPLNVAVNYHPTGGNDLLAGATVVRGVPGLVIGYAGSRNLAYDADVFGHELFHVVHGQIVPEVEAKEPPALDALGFNTTPHAVSEAVADYFSCTLSGDPEVGEYSGPALGLPFLSTLANDARFPEDRTGQAHADGQALSAALWEARAVVGAAVLDQALYDALAEVSGTDYPGRGATGAGFTFPRVVEAVLRHVGRKAKPAQLSQVRQVFVDRGLTVTSDIIPIEPGEPRRLWMPGPDDAFEADLPQLDAVPAPLQLRLAVPPDADGLTIIVVEDDDEEEEDGHADDDATEPALPRAGFRIYVGIDHPVRFLLEDETLTVQADLQATTAQDTVRFTGDQVGLLRGKEVYLSIANPTEDTTDLLVAVAVHREGMP